MRLSLLLLLTGLALIVARRSVDASAERVIDNPLKVTVVGLVAEVLVLPVLVLTAIVLSISIIGIPLLLLLPFVVLGLILMALVGFTGTAAAIGEPVQRRYRGASLSTLRGAGRAARDPLAGHPRPAAGRGRLAGHAGRGSAGGVGFTLELLAWASGFGAMLRTAFSGWQARRPRGGTMANQG